MINKDETNSIQTPKITWGHTREILKDTNGKENNRINTQGLET